MISSFLITTCYTSRSRCLLQSTGGRAVGTPQHQIRQASILRTRTGPEISSYDTMFVHQCSVSFVVCMNVHHSATTGNNAGHWTLSEVSAAIPSIQCSRACRMHSLRGRVQESSDLYRQVCTVFHLYLYAQTKMLNFSPQHP